MAMPIKAQGPLTQDERDRIVENVKRYQEIHGLTLNDLSKMLGDKRGNTISQLLSGTYNVSDATLNENLRKLNDAIELDARRRAGRAPDKPLATTHVVKLVKTAVDICRQNCTMGYVTGPAGCGKTATIKEIIKTEPGTVYVMAQREVRSPSKMLGYLANVLGVGRTNRRRNFRGSTLSERIREQLKGSHRLIVVDEAQKLEVDTIELFREIHDYCEVPVLMVGSFDLAELIRSTTTEDGGQLESRFGPRFDVIRSRRSPGARGRELPIFTLAQIREILTAPGLRFNDDAMAYLLRLANENGKGAVRRVRFVVAIAARMARKRGDGTVMFDDIEWVVRNNDSTHMDDAILTEHGEEARKAVTA